MKYTFFGIGSALLMSGLLHSSSAIAESQIVISNAALQIGGDFRYRHEYIDDATKDEPRGRQRFRLRLSIDAEVTDNIHVIGRIATGSSDATSTNQTADGAFSSKESWIDLAYVKVKPSIIPSSSIQAGKMKNPFKRVGKSQLIWDGDVNPEGVSFSLSPNRNGLLFGANAAYFWIDEISGSKYDVTMAGGQAYVGLKGDLGSLTVGGGVYDFRNVLESKALTDDGFNGNMSLAGGEGEDDVYLNGYTLTNTFAELKLKQLPVSVYADFVQNIDALDGDNMGWLFGGSIGNDKKGDLPIKLSYFYREVERDAVIAAFSDSDFGGGGTDNSGHVGKLSLGLNKYSKLSATYFSNIRKVASGDNNAYDRAQFDINVKF